MSNNGPQAAGSSGWIELFPNDWIAEPPDGQGLVESDIPWPEGQPSRVDFQHSQPSNALVTSEAHQAGPSSLDQGKGLGRPVTAPTDPDTSDFRQSAKQLDAWLGNIQMEVDPLVVPRADANPLPADVPIFDLLSQGPPTIPFPPSTPTYAPFVATLSSEYRGHEASSFSTSPTDANTGSSRRGVAFIPLARSVSVTPSSTLCVSPGSFADSPFESQHISVVDSGPESHFMSPPNHHTRMEAESFPQEMLGMLREGAKLARQFNNSRSPHPDFAPTPMTDPDGQDNSTTLGDNNSDDESSYNFPHRTPSQKCQYCREWHTNLRRHHRSTCKSPQNPKQKHSAECLICGGTEGQNRARHKKTKRHVAATRRAEGGFGIIVSVR
ncbi:hypothetical protein FRB97_000430 [Tulasnella sp. 331]|nr:hypothetical protein FRB97_000430 [Tulasnella sp. 331]